MARVTDGATGPAFGKPARVSPSGLSSRGRGDQPAGAPVRAQPARPAARLARPVLPRRASLAVAAAVQFLKDVRAEMNRVAWPDRQTVVASSLVVVFVLVVTALYLAGWDVILAEIFNRLLKP